MRKNETECIHFERCMKKMEYQLKKEAAADKRMKGQMETAWRNAKRGR